MTLLQASIGALNDLVDAERDAGHKPGKPIPAGIVSPAQARAVALACAAAGTGIALLFSPALAALALAGLAIGAWYDLRAKGTTLSWLPLAVGIPLLPVFGWYGGAGELPGMFLVVVPAAANAGAALAIANALVDLEPDGAAGSSSIALALGEHRAGLVVVGLHAVVALLASGTALLLGAPSGWAVAVAGAALVPLGGALVGLVAEARAHGGLREASFEVQAVGTGLLAVAWLGALSAAAGPSIHA